VRCIGAFAILFLIVASRNFQSLKATRSEVPVLVLLGIIGFAAGVGIDGIVSFGRAVLEAADNLDAAAEKAGVGDGNSLSVSQRNLTQLDLFGPLTTDVVVG
jgi:hypothetical protein